jgi:hypothetical protein
MTVPDQLREYPLIRVCHPDCKVSSHGDCNSPGKRPVTDIHSDKILREIRSWQRIGGNYGVVARDNSDLVILDSDSEQFTNTVRSELPQTFTVKTGSGSYHYYFRSDYSQNQNIRDSDGELGSIRASNYQAVGPSSVHPETREKYRVYRDTDITLIPKEQISDFLTVLDSRINREDGGGGGGRSSRQISSTKKAQDLEIKPTQETLASLDFINSAEIRDSIGKVIDHDHPPRQARVWACSWLHSVGGLRENQLRRLLEELAEWASDRGRIRVEVKSLIQSSIEGDRAKESVNLDYYLGSDDMGASKASESRKMEESGKGQTLQGGENTMPEFNEAEEVQVNEGDSDGDRVVQAVKVNGADGADTFDFVSIRKGRLREVTLTNGEQGVMADIDPTDGKSIGSTADLDLVIEALEELRDEI